MAVDKQSREVSPDERISKASIPVRESNLRDYDVPEEELTAAIDSMARRNLAPVSTGLAVIYAVLGVGHFVFVDSHIQPTMVILAGCSALVLLLIRLFVGRFDVPRSLVHPLTASLCAVVLINSFTHLFLTEDPLQTTNFLLVIIGAGSLLLNRMWFALCLGTTVLSWLVLVILAAEHPMWIHFGFALFLASMLGVLIFLVRYRSYRNLVVLRLHEQRQRSDLEMTVAELTNARGKIEKLEGLLPICASCKKVRLEDETWQELDHYIVSHSEAEVSHGLCPTCVVKLYPGFVKKEDFE